MENVYIVDGARTAFTSFGGSFKNLGATELGVYTAKEALKRSEVDQKEIDHIIYGNVIHSEVNAAYLARHIGLNSDISQTVPALTLNRLCGSGLQSIVSAAQHIQLGEAGVVLAGGSENMSQSPFSNFQQRFGGPKLGDLEFDDMLQNTLTDQYTGNGMGMTAEKLAEQYHISREEQDEYAIQSNKRAAKAIEDGKFDKEIVQVPIKHKKEIIYIGQDEHVKPDASIDKLSKLKPVFKEVGSVTAANSSGINDGAASLVVAGEESLGNQNPLSRIVAWGVSGVDPTIMGIGPVPAINQALERAGLSLNQIDLIEVNEAFAAQYLAVEKELGLNRDITNVNGGAISLGHPVGASGSRLLLSAAYELHRRNGKYGVVSLCIGGGQGIAMVIENV